MTNLDIDRAVIRLLRRLDVIMACTSGQINFERVAERVYAIRKALADQTPKPPARLNRHGKTEVQS